MLPLPPTRSSPASTPLAPTAPPRRTWQPVAVPPLEDCVALPGGEYPLGEGADRRTVRLARVLIGRHPVVVAHAAAFLRETDRDVSPELASRLDSPLLADHPVTEVTRADALAFCAWAAARLGRAVRLPTGDEWEALARGPDERAWPWGPSFDPERCACAEAGAGWTAPVGAHPQGVGPFGAEQLAGNVWEWVADRAEDGWGVVRGGSYLDHAWGVRAAHALPADPARATATTGFRIAIDHVEPGRDP